jgi:flagellar motor switch protein FliM
MLTQAEIDALLAGTIDIEQSENQGRVNLADIIGEHTSTGPESAEQTAKDERVIQPYNFWSPDRFSKDQIRAVELIHEDLAERLTTSLPSFLRTNLRPRVVHIEQGRFHDFLKDLNPTTLFHLITLSPLPGQMVLTISPEISYVILEQRLGGKSERSLNARSLTEIDQSLLRGMVEHMLNDIKATWNKVISVEPGLEDSTINQHWVQMIMGNERVLLVTFELTIQGVSGAMNIYVPFSMLKPVAGVLNPHVWISGRKERQMDTQSRQAAIDGLSQVSMPVRVNLGNINLSFSELIGLQLEDLFVLDTKINEELPVLVGGRPTFLATLGRSGNQIVAQITRTINPQNGGEPV